jgi:hypothetical protein
MKKVLFVGGTFDTTGGKASGLCDKIIECLKAEHSYEVTKYNGGDYSKLQEIIQTVTSMDIVFWFVDVPNDLPKARNVKELNPKAMLVTSKRNDGRYTFGELISRAMESKSNLVFEFSKLEFDVFTIKVFDPLGNLFFSGENIEKCMKVTIKRLSFLSSMKRIGSIKVGETAEVPDCDEFFSFVKGCGEFFHNIIIPDPTETRFQGNSGFRCQSGFPSFRASEGDIFVSRRDVDKRFIEKDAFVKVRMGETSVEYWGNYKPSVDTPIQLELYKRFPQINYMIHGHCYARGGRHTEYPVSCGDMEEVSQILSVVAEKYNNYFDGYFYLINLRGHGCLIMSSNVDQMVEVQFYPRTIPESFHI